MKINVFFQIMSAYLHNNYETLLCRKLPQAHEVFFIYFFKEIKNHSTSGACVIAAL